MHNLLFIAYYSIMERIQAKISLRFNVYFTAVLIEAKKLQVIVVLLAA